MMEKKVFGEPQCGGGGGGGGGWRRSGGGGGDRLKWRRRWWRRPAQVASTVAEETDGVESDRDLESFRMKNETTQGGLLFICLKISATDL
jgi:hypothetical protein